MTLSPEVSIEEDRRATYLARFEFDVLERFMQESTEERNM